MGNEFSWPCTDRKERARKIQESKYESWLTEDDGHPRETLNIESRNTTQILKNKREFLTPGYNRTNTGQSTGSPMDQAFDSQSVSSMADRGPRVVIRCEDISDFKAFMDDVASSYDYLMVPTHIATHPYLPQPIILLQAQEFAPNFKTGKETNLKFKHLVKRFEPASRATLYQDLTTYLKAQCDKGLEYVGYFVTEDNGYSAKFNFIFLERAQTPGKPYTLQFETLDTIDEKTVNRILSERSRDGYRFKGMVHWNAVKDQSFLNTSMNNKSLIVSGMHVMIFEKDSQVPSIHHVVEFRGEDLEPDTLESRISNNIDRTCDTNKFEVAGIITNRNDESILMILSEE